MICSVEGDAVHSGAECIAALKALGSARQQPPSGWAVGVTAAAAMVSAGNGLVMKANQGKGGMLAGGAPIYRPGPNP